MKTVNLDAVAAALPTEKGTWDDLFFTMALACTIRSDCTRRQFGCVAVSPQKRIVATGYNAPPSGEDSAVERCINETGSCDRDTFMCCKKNGEPKNSAYDACNANHAEHNCLNQLGTANHYEYVDLYLAGRDGATGMLIPCNLPCIYCSRTIKNYNVRYIYCLSPDGTVEILQKKDLKTTA
jgi:deoxycytidylate deaminase